MSDPADPNTVAIAIVGMAGRFPGARSVYELWENLRDGVESITFLDDDELRASGVDEELLAHPNYVKACAFLEDPDHFDAPFFDVTPREAELMDPQQRVFLECAWEAFEDAGYDVSRFDGSIGVFAGAGKNHYYAHNLLRNRRILEAMGPVATTIASEKDFVATRVSYKLDLSGPSLSVQTACSTSLVATHLACQSLLSGECDMALAGGASISSFRRTGYLFVDGGIFSPDGHLRAFDAKAGGQVGGNGAGVVVLKRLADALEDGDTIHAVIKGSALNNDGLRKVSFNAPGVEGQARVVAEALEVAGVSAATIGYVECHGTGTHLGDPIEVAALTEAFRAGTDATGFCGLGSLKTNVGHLDTAAGVAGLIKAALTLEHAQIPPSLNFEQPSPELKLESSPFYVNTDLCDWPPGDAPRRAGVSSFGMGGTNAHVILEEPPAPTAFGDERALGDRLLVLSARTEPALDAACARMAAHLASDAGRAVSLADAAYTTQVGRRAFAVRRAVVSPDRDTALVALRGGGGVSDTCDERALEKGRDVAFLFSGQGSQYANMTRGLYDAEPRFRAQVDRCCEALVPHLGLDLRTLLFPAAGEEEAAGRELGRTQHTQPALFVVEYALARLLDASGVRPAAMLGHSVGEYVAACLAGVFSLEDALRIVTVRGRLIGSLPEGSGMMAVALSEPEVGPLLDDGVSIAVVNAPELVVVAGPSEALDALKEDLRKRKVAARALHTSHAFHSAQMDPILAEFEAEMRSVELGAPAIPVVSCTTGTRLTDDEARDPGYWVRHIREPVRFATGVGTLLAEDRALLEVGPGQALTSLAKLSAAGATVLPTTRQPGKDGDDVNVFVESLGRLWCAGVELDWAGLHAGARRRRVPLPTYPFERRRYWVEPEPDPAGGARPDARLADPAEWFWCPSWRRGVASQSTPRVPDRVLLFADAGAPGDALATRWRAAGAEVVTVSTGPAFAESGPGAFQIAPGNADDYARLLDALAFDGGGARTEIVHALCTAAPRDASLEALDASQDRGFYSLLFLVQALEQRGVTTPVRIQVVTAGMQDVLDDLTAPEHATILGICKAVAAEVDGVSCRSVDVAADVPAEAVFDELSRGEAPVVALRGRQRWLPALEPVRIEEADVLAIPSPHPPGARAADPAVRERLRQKCVVLITGGLGGIGLALAEELAREVSARLVLVGRSGLPRRDAWDAWVGEHGETDATSRRIVAVRRIESLGGEVLVCRADASRLDEMRAVVEQSRSRFGAVHGVIHAAGLPGAGLLLLKTRAAAAAVLDPKVRGTRVLEQALAGETLDFFALASSLATALDGVGQADYFAANGFLDAFAASKKHDRCRVVSISWEAWRDAGMAAQTVVPEALRAGREESLRLGLSSDEGRDVFRRLLASSLPHVLVSTRDLPSRIEAQVREARELAGDGDPGAMAMAASAAHARPKLATAFVEARTETERAVAKMWADLLGIEAVGAEDDFFELGGNSLLLMQVSVRLRADLDVALSMRELFDTPTAATLAERVDSMRLVDDVRKGGDDRVETGSPGDTEEFRL